MQQSNRNGRKRRFSLSQFFTYALLTIWGVTTVYPFLWVIINSFRVKGEIRTDSFSIFPTSSLLTSLPLSYTI